MFKKLKPILNEKLLQISLIFFLLFFVFVIPPFQKPDEITHYYLALNYSHSLDKCQEQEIDDRLFNLPIISQTGIAHHPSRSFSWDQILEDVGGQSATKSIGNTCPALLTIAYLPQALGINIGNLFFLNSPYFSLIAFYLGRLTIAIVFFYVLTIVTKKISPQFKPFLYVFSFLPMVLNQVTAYSYDGLLICVGLVLFLAITKIFIEKNNSNFYRGIFLGSLLLTQYVKPGYYFLPFLSLLLPWPKKWQSRIKFLIFNLIFYILCFLPFLITVFNLSGAFALSENGNVEGRSVNMSQQLILVLHDPVQFIKAFIITNYYASQDFVASTLGVLGWLDYWLPYWFYLSLIFILSLTIAYIIKKDPKPYFNKWQLMLLSLILFSSYVFIFLTMYLVWSEVGSLIINGVQGRYFLILIPLLILLIHDLYFYLKKINLIYYLIILLSLAFFVLSYETHNRYYNYRNTWTNKQEIEEFASIIDSNQDFQFFELPIKNYTLTNLEQKQSTGFAFYTKNYNLTDYPNLMFEIKDENCEEILVKGFITADTENINKTMFVSHQLITGHNSYCYSLTDLDDELHEFKLQVLGKNDAPIINTLFLP